MHRRLILICALIAPLIWATVVVAGEPAKKTVEALYLEKTALSGKQVQFKGKVVKVTNGVMNKNFLHIQDGSGSKGTNDITVTSKDTANIGDEVVVTGIVATDRDFGAGYTYPLLVEEATISAVTASK